MEMDVPKLAQASAAIYQKWDHLISRYHAGCPEALIAVRMKVESNGRMDAPGDVRQGEVGLLQITASTEKRFGVPSQFRYTAEGNVFLGALRYNVDTAIVLKRYPGLARDAFDAYLYGGMLVSAIGIGATFYLYDRAPRGLPFKDFVDWVDQYQLPATGPWGRQSLKTIRHRIRAVWIMGEAAKLLGARGVPNIAARPAIPPLPRNLSSVTIPAEVRGELRQQTGGEGVWMPRAGDVALTKPSLGVGRAFVFGGIGVVVGAVTAVIWRLMRRGRA